MKTKVLFLAVSLGVLVAKPIWAQQQNPDPTLSFSWNKGSLKVIPKREVSQAGPKKYGFSGSLR